jgi:hypothetical protein
MTAETFTLDLGDEVRCTARIDASRLATLTAQTLPNLVTIEWAGQRRDAHFERYLEWIAGVWQHVANITNKSLCTVISAPHRVYVIACKPHRLPVVKPVAFRP